VGSTVQQRAEELARTVGRRYGDVASVTRFPTGLCHHVFDVDLGRDGAVVVRVADPANRHLLVGALAWSALLRPLGVPLPEVLGHDVAAPLPHVVLERLPGDDLGVVHDELSREQRRSLAGSVVAVQQLVHSLGPATGYGYSADPAARPPRERWSDVVDDDLRRSGGRLAGGPEHVRDLHARVVARAAELRPLLDATPATPFLDDLTTKNVLVADGRLTGVVDVDVVCFGDPLWTPALTRVSLVATGRPTDYVEAWLALLAPDADARTAFDLCTAVFCLGLLSEDGVVFNRGTPAPADEQRTRRLVSLATGLLDGDHGAPATG
jgi:aminoglycoside phosphotransferase (APT) family kinase protein